MAKYKIYPVKWASVSMWRKPFQVALGVLLVAGPWIGLLSYHYGRPTFSTIGPIQHAIMGPPDMPRDHPDHFHFFKPEPGRITVAEDPTNLPYNYWSPFESVAYARHQATLVYHNALLAVKFLQSFDWLGLGLFSAICGMLGLCTRSSTH